MMSPILEPIAPTRKELEVGFKNPRLVRAVEKIFQLIPSELNALTMTIETIVEVIEIAEIGNRAADSINLIAQQVALSVTRPVSQYPVLDFIDSTILPENTASQKNEVLPWL